MPNKLELAGMIFGRLSVIAEDGRDSRGASSSQQQRNRRTNHVLAINGIAKTLVEWEEETGIKANTILTRVRRGWPSERLLEIANAPALCSRTGGERGSDA